MENVKGKAMLVGIQCFIFLISLGSICQGDEIVLRSGKHLTGNIVSFEENDVTFETATNQFSINIKLVEDITTDTNESAKKELIEKIYRKMNEYKKNEKDSKKTQSSQMQSNKVGIEVIKGIRSH